MSAAVAAGVVGVGAMGRNHARVYAELPGVDLVGVSDVDDALAREVADEFDTVTYDLAELLARADVVSIAVPTRFHFDVARQAIEAGVHVLVEKPVTATVEEGRELAALADAHGVVVQVGHVERFNPAVTALFDVMADLTPVAFEAHRLGPPPARRIDDGVVLDLMIHDLDVVCALAGSGVESVHGFGTADGQHATAHLGFADGTLATLTASRRTQKKVRTLEVTAEECFVTVDYIDQSLRIHRHSNPEYRRQGSEVSYRNESVIEQPMLSAGEPLKLELAAFVEATTTGSEPVVGIDDGLRALALATLVTERVGDGPTGAVGGTPLSEVAE